ncbi:hypothetical protein CBR_g10786 [Chara braunii]|uniref:Uncharacterized protein n=1 Tax=Chara braunii TaxID=69332 RepID=A0A388KP85_CHABU|nr:hypothetical protein CBR_g10786 [Chara braunii]|eukprot:GBG71847.1 hypothetical protein CBR_g10786 [Chara braunii]
MADKSEAMRPGTEGNFMGIIFGEVRDDNLSAIMDELLVFLVKVLDDLPLEILSCCNERPRTRTLTRSLEPHLLWSTCIELDEGSYYLPSRGVFLTVDITDLSTWDPLVRRILEGQTREEVQEEEEESEGSAEDEERNDDPDHQESDDEVLGEVGSKEDNEEQGDESEEEDTSTDSSEAAELMREEQDAEDQKQREKAKGKHPVEDSGPPPQLLQGNPALNPEPPREKDERDGAVAAGPSTSRRR